MRVRKGLLVAPVVVVLLFLLAEGSLRLYFALAPTPTNSTFVPDPDCGYRLRPGPFWEDDRAPEDIVNSFGFRDSEQTTEKTPGTYRVIGIGDSFVLGPIPTEENFLRFAEQAANSSPLGDSLEIDLLLMGLGGYGPHNELGVLRSTALTLNPDLVLLCLYIGNDITGVELRGEVLGGTLYFTSSPNRLHNLLRKSRLFILIEKVMVARWRTTNLRKQEARSRDDRLSAAQGTTDPTRPSFYYLLIQRKRLPVYELEMPKSVERLWTKTEEILLEFDHACRAAGVPWILTLIPTEEQVDPVLRAEILEALSIDPGRLDFDRPRQRLLRFAEQHGIETIDLLPAFRARDAEGTPLYIPNDTHWNREGNQLAGELIARRLRQVARADTVR